MSLILSLIYPKASFQIQKDKNQHTSTQLGGSQMSFSSTPGNVTHTFFWPLHRSVTHVLRSALRTDAHAREQVYTHVHTYKYKPKMTEFNDQGP